MTRILASLLIALFAVACSQADADTATPPVATTPAPVADRVAAAIEDAQATVAAVGVPAGHALTDMVQATVPAPALDESRPVLVSPAAVAHIIRWEVTSEARYRRALQSPIWPGGASGITWGIGYDGGHQSTRTILRDWQGHPHAGRLASTSGITGERARAVLPQFRDIVVEFEDAIRVFISASVPVYHAATVRAYGDILLQQPQGVIDALFGNTYNRGGSMVGSRNTEKRAIRDDCLPRFDTACTARQLRLQCRLWDGTPNGPGLCGRRESEAQLVEASA